MRTIFTLEKYIKKRNFKILSQHVTTLLSTRANCWKITPVHKGIIPGRTFVSTNQRAAHLRSSIKGRGFPRLVSTCSASHLCRTGVRLVVKSSNKLTCTFYLSWRHRYWCLQCGSWELGHGVRWLYMPAGTYLRRERSILKCPVCGACLLTLLCGLSSLFLLVSSFDRSFVNNWIIL